MSYTIYVGTYTQALPFVTGKGAGIYHCEFEAETGTAGAVRLAAKATNPSFVCAQPDGRMLYAVGETEDYRGTGGGSVAAFAVEGGGLLRRVTQRPSGGGAPCHLALSADGKTLLCANYLGGNLGRLALGNEHELKRLAQVAQHSGSGPNAARQEAAHVHSSLVVGEWVLAADLGIDRLVIYREEGRAGLVRQGELVMPPGSGPRHLLFSAEHKLLYVVGELDCAVHTLHFDPATGSGEWAGAAPTLPIDFQGENTAAHLALSPDGRFLYASNRGHDSLAVFQVEAGGRLAVMGHFPSAGKIPRHFAITPDGRYLLAANQNSDQVAVLRRDAGSGELEDSGERIGVPTPVCVLILSGD